MLDGSASGLILMNKINIQPSRWLGSTIYETLAICLNFSGNRSKKVQQDNIGNENPIGLFSNHFLQNLQSIAAISAL